MVETYDGGQSDGLLSVGKEFDSYEDFYTTVKN